MNSISVIVTLCNRWPLFKKSLGSLRRILTPADELIVVDFESTDKDIHPRLTKRLEVGFPVTCLQLEKPFRNCYGLNAGADKATGDVLFFTHAEMLYPRNLREVLFANVGNKRCYFPLMLWERKGRETKISDEARGVCACDRTEFQEHLRWDETLDAFHGTEDTALWEMALRKGFQIVREVMPELVHMWHPQGRRKKMEYYEGGPGGLPERVYEQFKDQPAKLQKAKDEARARAKKKAAAVGHPGLGWK